MTRHFATLFDSAYCAKGLALHESLLKHSSEPFVLHILACDTDTFYMLSDMKLKNVEVIPLEPFESAMKMQPVKVSRSWTEYCWTLASSFMEYLLPWFDSLTYLDADIFFFSDPKVIFEEIGERSIGIVPHRFNEKERKRLGKNGEFNVGVVYAKNSPVGLKCITKWAAQTREWCFGRNEGGKFGDQAYLNSWPTEYGAECCVIENLGVNLGPWSVGDYAVYSLYCPHGRSVQIDGHTLVCYHFHEFKDEGNLTNWTLGPADKELIYAPYVKAFNAAQERIAEFKRARQEGIDMAERRWETA